MVRLGHAALTGQSPILPLGCIEQPHYVKRVGRTHGQALYPPRTERCFRGTLGYESATRSMPVVVENRLQLRQCLCLGCVRKESQCLGRLVSTPGDPIIVRTERDADEGSQHVAERLVAMGIVRPDPLAVVPSERRNHRLRSRRDIHQGLIIPRHLVSVRLRSRKHAQNSCGLACHPARFVQKIRRSEQAVYRAPVPGSMLPIDSVPVGVAGDVCRDRPRSRCSSAGIPRVPPTNGLPLKEVITQDGEDLVGDLPHAPSTVKAPPPRCMTDTPPGRLLVMLRSR